MKNKDNSKLADFSKILFATAYVAMVSPTTSALAASGFSTTKTELANPPSQLLIANDSENPSDILPEEVKNSVVQDISEREGVEASALQVVKAEKETWSDGCLGLKTSGLCTMATIPGWRVTVTDAQQTWVYRTDESGSMAKLDEESTKIASTTMVRRQITTQRVSTQIQKRQTVTAQRSTQVSAATVTSKNNKSGFTLAIWQPAGNLSEVIARVSIKGKRNQGYFKERFIGDYKYKIQQKAKFVKGLKSGDRVVVRLYDLENRFLGYSEFECLQTNSAVNLILSENPSQYKVVRTVYGADANFDGNVDTGSTTYDYFTQVDDGLSSTVGDRQVTFLSSSRQINISQFQVAGVSAVATKSVYPNSFTQGKYAVVRKSMSIFSSTQAAALQAVPGQLVQIKEVDSDSSFDVSQLMMAYREVGVARNIQVKFSDVASNHWAQDFIAELAALEIIEGFPNGTFRPDEQVNRAQFAAMLSQAFEKVKVRNALKFKDVSSNFWAYSAIREAYEMGFLGIIDSEFKPTQELSRLEVLIALAKGLNYTVTGSTERILTAYTDATSIRSDVRSAIAALTERGIVVNYPNVQSLNPGKVATRAEVSALIYKALVSTGTVTDISSEYTVGKSAEQAAVEEENETKTRRHCNQGIGNGSEGCDPGNSRPHGGSNDETGRTPGNKK